MTSESTASVVDGLPDVCREGFVGKDRAKTGSRSSCWDLWTSRRPTVGSSTEEESPSLS